MQSLQFVSLLAAVAVASDFMITTYTDSLCTGTVLGNVTASFGQTVEMNSELFIAIRIDKPPTPVVETRCPVINSYSTPNCQETEYELGISMTSMCNACDSAYGFTTTCDPSSDTTVIIDTDCSIDPDDSDSCYQCSTQYPLQANTCTNTSASLQFISFKGVVPCVALNYTYWFAPDPNVPCMDVNEVSSAKNRGSALRVIASEVRAGKTACPVAATMPAGLCSAGVLVTLLN